MLHGWSDHELGRVFHEFAELVVGAVMHQCNGEDAHWFVNSVKSKELSYFLVINIK